MNAPHACKNHWLPPLRSRLANPNSALGNGLGAPEIGIGMSHQLRIATVVLAGLGMAPGIAVAPALAAPLPLPTAPSATIPSGLPAVVTGATGALIQARTEAGSSVPGAVVFVYHAHPAADGWQQPVGSGITDAAGNVTIPLPTPTTDVAGPGDSNYVATYFGLGTTGGANGVRYFATTPDVPISPVTIENNLPPSPCEVPQGVTSIDPNQWGYKLTEDSDEEGNVHVATAHGAGSWSGNSVDMSGLEGSYSEAIGEMASTTYERTTLGTVGMRVVLKGLPVSESGSWLNDGFLKFGVDTSTNTSQIKEFDVEQAGLGAVAIIAPAKWAHTTANYTCPGPTGEQSYTTENIAPLTWDASRSPFKEAASAEKDTFDAMINDYDTSYPVSGGIDFATGTGRGQSYGTDAGIEVTPILEYAFSSETHYDGTTLVHFYSGNGCGQAGFEKCYYYTDPATKLDCPDDLLCGSDFYTAVVPPGSSGSTVPGPAPRPCTPNTARNLCD